MAPNRRLTVWLTSAVDWLDHAVTDSDFEAGLIAGQGVYPALCGAIVPPCSMLTPPGPPCRTCEQRLPPPPRKPRLWRRLLPRRRDRAGDPDAR